MAYLSDKDLAAMNFKFLGANVKISEKAAIYDCELISVGNNSRIDDFCILSGNLRIGKNVHITPTCLIAGGQPGILLDDYVTLAYGARVFAQSDDYSGASMTNSLIPAEYKDEIKLYTSVAKLAIVGAGSTILPGAHVGEGAAVGAMSLVVRPIDSWGIYAGVPVRRLGNRQKKILRYLEQYERNDPHTL